MMRLRVILPAAGLAAGLLLGCGSSGDGSAARATPAATQSQAPAEPTATATPAAAQARKGVRLVRIGSFSSPVFVTAPRGARKVQFVVEQGGRIMVVRNGRKLGTPFLDISSQVTANGEQGLLSMAFAPDYASSGRFYVYFTDNDGDQRVVEYRRASANRADPNSRRSVLRVPHHRFNHKGGQLQVGPDGMLYAGFGDGGAGGDPDENAQNLGRMLGKIIRIDPRPNGGYSIPPDNPFRNRSGALPEIYAYGVRNPWRFSFDRRTGAFTLGDVGQDEIEEIDFIPARSGGRQPRGGYNFGWDTFEGRSRYESGSAPGQIPPVLQRTHSQGYCSITGGYVIRDRSLGRGWTGQYVFGDYCDGTLRLSRLRRPSASYHATSLKVSGLASFGEDGRGRVYAVSLNGPVYRIGR